MGSRDERYFEVLRRLPIPDKLLRNFGRLKIEPPTARQLEVARCMSHGLTEEMTADALGISLNTVKTHTKELRYRTGAKNITHAICKLLREGVID